ncbi:hypothetical protein ACM9XA_11245 [Xanthomonas sacchari]
MGVATTALVAAGVSAAAGAYSANQAKKGAQGAANATIRAQDQARAENTANMQPWLTAGQNALTQMQQLNAGNFSSFKESPDYAWNRDQSLQALDRSAAASGSLYSGGHSADLMDYASGLASQQYGNFYNRLTNIAGMGQSAAGALAGVNTGYANAVGDANANAAATTANANSQLAAGIGGLANNYLQSRQSSYAPQTNQLSTLFAKQVNTGAGSNYNFGNNVNNLVAGGW